MHQIASIRHFDGYMYMIVFVGSRKSLKTQNRKDLKMTCKCKQCGKEYEYKETKRIYGDMYWIGKYCCAFCYTQATTGILILNQGERNEKLKTDTIRRMLQKL